MILPALLLRLFGWKGVVDVEIPPKCVICVAPHTSNWDLVIGRLFYASVKGKPHFLMKKEWFFFPLNHLFKALGGIPVDRKRKSFVTEQMIEEFNQKDHFQLAISPEATRKKNSNWKSGFYYIALGANVPISLAHIDYGLKEVGICRNFYPTGDETVDIETIKQYYKDFMGKFPEQFSV
ncbi:MAG: 1-acyl-sn-glycerol-3-phosphate acyltransferase [Dysgonamonadaceae bacterium]|jgi:1-acyl-sn-glycerol-3-phosphate acyltransferase|nr:1-acyl-sn-glycerol-3-phosphate acyltransferase [Dysgonamonadaceae bacterium]